MSMELWEKIIVEWINCLKIVTEPLKNTKELQNGTFYINFLKLIKWTKYKDDYNGENIIIRFIEDEYPSFKVHKDDNMEHVYIASLLLVHLCRPLSAIYHSLQFNMCDNLKHETQIKVKAFLESILPIGKDITKETMREVIMEVEDASMTPKHRGLFAEDCSFPNSPISCSGRSKKIMTERIRELRDLRSSLAVERFANADLRDDLTRQQNKIQKLQSKLDEQSAQLKALREERMKPSTPQPSYVKADASQENYYKKYINDLESQLNKQQKEMDQLETEKDVLSKELCSLHRTSTQREDNYANYERSMESLLSKIESKDRELVELRIHNEELRVHIKELNKNSNIEQSFEVDDLMPLPVLKSLNTSEALSSVIEIQLQEAKEESAILHAQIDSLKGKLQVLTKDYKTAMEVNRDLQDKVKTLEEIQAKLNDTQKKLHILNTDLTNLQAEKLSLIAQNQDLESLFSSKKEELSKTKQSNTILNIEIDNLKLDIKNLYESLQSEKTNSLNLNTAVIEMKSQIRDYITQIHELTGERDLYKSFIENCNKNLKCILLNNSNNQFIQIEIEDLDKLTLDDFTKYFETMLHNCNTMCASYKCDIISLKTKMEETNTNMLQQQLAVATLEEQNVQNLIKLANIEEDKKQKNLLLNEQQEIIHKHLQKIEEISNEKHALEQNIHELTNNLMNQRLLLKSFIMQLKEFRNKDYELMREEIQQTIIEYQRNIKQMFENVQYNYQMLCCNFQQVEREKKDLEYNFNCSKRELSNIQITNVALQQDLLENRKIISTLEEKERILHSELNESKRYAQELRETNHRLEQQYAIMKTEANDNLKSLKSENAKISLELKDAINKLNLLQQEVNDVLIEIKLKEVQINELLSDVSSLKVENEYLIHSHEKVLKMKDEEIALKEETSLLLQTEMEKLTIDVNATEKKLKEIIINLQEVRTSQDAILATQEAALKEKCIHINELHEQFDNAKQILNKELENTRSSLREYQVKFFDLENEINNKNRAIIEIAEELTELKAEFKKNKEYCKLMDENQIKIVEFCKELEQSAKSLNSTIVKACSNSDFFDQNLYDTSQYGNITDNETANTLNIIKMTRDELQKSQKLILHLSCANIELNETLAEQKIFIENNVKDKEVCCLKNKIQELEIIAQKRNEYLKNLIKNKESLQEHLQKVLASQHDLDTVLTSSKQKWNEILMKSQNIFHCFTDSSICDEFKQFQAKKASFENILSKYQIDHLENMKFTSDFLWEKFFWTEQKLHDTYLCSVHEKECLEVLTSVEETFSNEKRIIDVKLEEYKALQINVMKSEEEMETFISLLTFYKDNIESGKIKTQADIEKNLQNQISQLTKEGKTLKNKIDTMRLRNVKLERNIDDLRMEIKRLKSTELTSVSKEANLEDLQSLKNELKCLKELNQNLQEEKVLNRIAKQEFDNQLKEVHATYERKLEDMKQKMKMAYNEQMTKLNHTQEKIVRERLQTQMEAMCQKQREELNRYKAHISELSSQLWSVGEKLLNEQQQKQEALQHLKELQIKLKEDKMDQSVSIISRKICTTERQEILPENVQQATQMTALIKEETFERRHSIRSIQVMGNAFKTEDEDEIFDNVYLADIKRGNCSSTTNADRLSVLQMRNSLCKPHLKSSYPAEMQFLPSTLTEEEIKSGSPIEENFNDSLSQSLLPEQKVRRKDRSQTSYKKPGPPTPSKNGGRLSLQGNVCELRSPNSRILRERNIDRRTMTTPHSLKNIFSSKRQDENVSSTPKGRRLSNLFRKPRLQPDRSDR